jgi:phosphatidylserine/phosphatidylglycerophosphate/cardiolipin synthase-like enzyme
MARPPHKLKKDKLLEGVGGLRIQDEVGAKIHKLKRLRLHAKLLLADNVRGIVGSINLAPGASTAGGNASSKWAMSMWLHDCAR